MFKNQELIDKLTEEQKLRLITGFAGLSDDKLNAAGMPRVVAAELEDLNDKYGTPYPPHVGLANSWNTELIANVASDLAFRAATDANVIYTPPAYLRSSPYAAGLSEDPFLNKSLASSVCRGIESTGALACLTDCSVRAVDASFLDKTPDPRALNELLFKTYIDLIKADGGISAVASSPKPVKKRWQDVNSSGVTKALSARSERVRLIHVNATQDVTVASMPKHDELVSDTSVGALKAALINYRRVKADVDRGAVSLEELNKAIADGVAVSDEMLDAALDKVIDFANECAKRRPLDFLKLEYEGQTEDDMRARLNSRNAAAKTRAENVQRERFGDTEQYRSALSLLASEESIVLLKNSDVLPLASGKRVAFLGDIANTVPGLSDAKSFMDSARRTLTGFADGYDLAADRSDEITDEAIKLCEDSQIIVLFLGPGRKREKAMGETCSLTLPANQLALVDRVSALGKPIVAVMVGDFLPDMRFDEKCDAVVFAPRSGANAGRAILNVLTGAFNPCGRLAATAYDDTDVTFKNLRDYKNAGRNKVGVFVGYRYYTTDGTPAKYPFGHGLSYSRFEYTKFKRTDSGVSVTVKNKSKQSGSEVVQLYVQKSGSAIVRPARELKGFTKVRLKGHEKKTVHIPLDDFELAVFDKRSGKFKVEGGEYSLFVGSSVVDLKFRLDINIDGDVFEESGDKLSDYLRNVSNVVEDDFMLHGGKGKKQKITPRVLPDFPYEKLFLDEFGMDIEDDDEVDEEITVFDDDEEDIGKYIGMGVSPKQVADGLTCSLASQGISADKSFVRSVVSALAASRLMFVCTEDEQLYFDFVSALGAFMGCNPVNVDALTYAAPDDLFLEGDVPTPLAKLVGSSQQKHSVMQLVSVTNVMPATLHEYFTPFVRYISNPENNRITYGDYGDADKTLVAAPNIWFVMRVTPDCAATVPAHIADISASVVLNVRRDGGAEKLEPVELNYYRFVNAFEQTEKNELNERGWKAIDKVVNYANGKSGAKLNNKMWIQMEKFIGAYLSMTDDESANNDALDAVVAAKLVPMFAPMLMGKLTKDDGDFSQTLRDTLGDDTSALSAAMATKLGVIAAR